MSAEIVAFPRTNLALRYAEFMAIGTRAEHRKEAIDEYMRFGQMLIDAGALAQTDLNRMIANRRKHLTEELQELSRL